MNKTIMPLKQEGSPFIQQEPWTVVRNYYREPGSESLEDTPSFDFFPLESAGSRWIKRVVDIGVSLVVVVGLLSWVTPLLALLIKFNSRGPVFFFQKRNKRKGQIFTCIKFRSMEVNEQCDWLPSAKNDPRITRVGQFLRTRHIDELPQFINVLLGDMSVIGPRPHMIFDNLKYDPVIEHYEDRLRVKPGITGLAQIMGFAGPVIQLEEMKQRVRIDNYYIRHWSLRLDGIILFRTINRLLLLLTRRIN